MPAENKKYETPQTGVSFIFMKVYAWIWIDNVHTLLIVYTALDPFVINCLYILEWFKSLRPFSCSLRPFSCLLRPFSCLLRPLQICEHFDWLK